MVQLSGRRHGGEDDSIDLAPIFLADVLKRIETSFHPVTPIETVLVGAALGRFLAADLVAATNVPANDQSAVDGYAFRHEDLANGTGTPFRLVGTAAAGHPLDRAIGPGEAARILTGAPMPPGTDSVAMQERVRLTEAGVSIRDDLGFGDNRRRAGEDITAGDRIFGSGRRLGPTETGVLASLGMTDIQVRAPLSIAVFSTGDELVDPGATLGPGQRFDSNRPALLALLRDLGMAPTDLGILPDRPEAIVGALDRAARQCDAILGSAGMSVGDEDHVRPAVEKLGALDFWDVAIKPGRPVAAGRVRDTPFFGLPGNPGAALVTFLLIVRPALLRLAGGQAPAPRRFPVEIDFLMARKPGRREFLRCTLHDRPDAGPVARRLFRDGSAVLSAIAGCDGFVEVAEDRGDLASGMTLPFIPKSEFGLWGRPDSF